MKYRGLFLADIHIGAMNYEDTYDGIMYLKSLLQDLTKDGRLDFIVIGGDFFHKQLYANDLYIKYAQKLMLFFLASAKKIRVVYGTSSHDSKQYGIFDTMTTDFPEIFDGLSYDFKVIEEVSDEWLFEDMHVLYVPEEYLFDKDDHYKEAFKEVDVYDYIFGHGIISEAFPYIKPKKNDHERRHAPAFTAEELLEYCKGDVLFGHYHIHSEYLGGSVSYVGSTFRWIYGEEEDKGCFYLEFNPEDEENKYHKEFIVNNTALTYISFIYGYKDKVYTSSEEMENTAKDIIQKKKKRKIDHLRVVFNIPVGYENPEGFMDFFKERFKEYKDIKLVFANGYVENERQLRNVEFSELSEDSKVLLDKNIPKEEKIAYFLKIRKGIEMPIDKIRKYLEIRKEN